MGRAVAGNGEQAERRRAAYERLGQRSARGRSGWYIPALSEDGAGVDAETSRRLLELAWDRTARVCRRVYMHRRH